MDPAIVIRDTLLFIGEKEKLLRKAKAKTRKSALGQDIKVLRSLVSHIAGGGDPQLCKTCEGQKKSSSCNICLSTGVLWPPE